MEIHLKLDPALNENHYLPYIQFSFARLRPTISAIHVSMHRYQDSGHNTIYDCHFEIHTRQGQTIAITDTQNDFDLAFKRALERSARILQRQTPSHHQRVS